MGQGIGAGCTRGFSVTLTGALGVTTCMRINWAKTLGFPCRLCPRREVQKSYFIWKLSLIPLFMVTEVSEGYRAAQVVKGKSGSDPMEWLNG